MHVLLHLEECTTSEVRVCGRKGTSYSLPLARSARSGRSGCERISPDPLGYGATQQIGRNLTLIYPTLGLGPGHVPQRSDIFFPMEGIWRDLNPGPLDSRGFWRGGLDVSGFRRIHWATGPQEHVTGCNSMLHQWGCTRLLR